MSIYNLLQHNKNNIPEDEYNHKNDKVYEQKITEYLIMKRKRNEC